MNRNVKLSAQFEAELLSAMKHDAGKGLFEGLPEISLEDVAENLMQARRVMILTGFPVRCEDGFRGETDGPPGTVNLAAALAACGCQVWLVTDQPSYPLLAASVSFRVPQAQVLCVEGRQSAALAAEWIDRIQPTHVISLERPGMSEDGHYHNIRGGIIDDMVADTEPFYQEARRCGAHTIGIGDGGNELGMGTYHKHIVDHVAKGELICARQGAEWPLVSGISNWWGWGLAALLSVKTGKMLLPTPEEETELLRRIVEAGAVDGCTSRREMTVDAMDLDEYLGVLREVRQTTLREMKRIYCQQH